MEDRTYEVSWNHQAWLPFEPPPDPRLPLKVKASNEYTAKAVTAMTYYLCPEMLSAKPVEDQCPE